MSPPHLSLLLFFLSLLLTLSSSTPPPMILTIVNNCQYPIWPDIQPNSGHPVLEKGGFYLQKLSHRSFPAPTVPWSGRVWARTDCVHHGPHFSCATGDCGGRLECDGLGGAAPATLAQFSIHHGHRDFSSYGVSLVDGFNVPMTVTPHEGQGNCPVVGCKEDLLATCPGGLQLRSQHRGHVIGCKSGCQAHPSLDELCCRNHFNSPQTCKPSVYSDFILIFLSISVQPRLRMHTIALRLCTSALRLMSSRSFSVIKVPRLRSGMLWSCV